MKISEFRYYRPTTVAEASDLGLSLGNQSRFLAGGTELLVDLKQGRDSASHIIALRGIPDLKKIGEDDSFLRIGGLATLKEIGRSSVVKRLFPSLCDAANAIGSAHIRNQATIGGNFCGAVPCADTPPICIAGEAQIKISGAGTERVVAAEGFISAPRKTVLKPGEILAEILIPRLNAGSGTSYQRFSLRRGLSLPVVSVAVRLDLEEDRIVKAWVVLGAAAPTPLSVKRCAALLVDEGKPSDQLFTKAARIAAEEALPIADLRGTKEFRRDLIRTMATRAFTEAIARAKGTTK